MAQYQGRRGPNVSQYIANLNAIPSAADMTQQEDFSNFEGDLDLFTNADFFDFDLNAPVSDIPNGIQFASVQQPSSPANSATDKLAFVNQQQFFPGAFNQFQANPALPGRTSLPPSPPNGVPFAGQIQQSQPTVPSPSQFQTALSSSPHTGDKRKSVHMATLSNPAELEEQARNAAEEDKRRRNTAASARFRVKKKQREQALEKTAKELSEKVHVLEARIGQLELENQWLKGLITEKNVKLEGGPGEFKATSAGTKDEVEGRAQDEVEREQSIQEMREDGERTPSEKKRGVGTE
ncbi:Regulatory protein cys-3 [Sphaceloma murrayae]|uniref:Regulatory protein cys-3 n=1 Tax=Sphaceloma murrayae TaxID=2082308 RepID=A0A2K1QFQ3_9PEZI|nr:Regulatory protein cys-3 [Sphaceloma murrayae]